MEGREKTKPNQPLNSIEYHKGYPAWRVHVENPGSFREVGYSTQFKLLNTPYGATLAWAVWFYDVPKRPYCVHRILELHNPPMLEFINILFKYGTCAVIFEGNKKQEVFVEYIKIDTASLESILSAGRDYNATLPNIDGNKAISVFTDIFNPIFYRTGSCEAGWKEMENTYSHSKKSLPFLKKIEVKVTLIAIFLGLLFLGLLGLFGSR